MIGLTGQFAAIDANLTGRENLALVGRLYHMAGPEIRRRATDLLERFELDEAADRPARTYSGGMKRRLDLAASLVGRPRVLFLDEPTTGLDPRSRIALWDVIAGLVAEGTTILLTTQYLEEADRLADKIAVIDLGKVIAEGTQDQLKAQIGGEVIELRLSKSRTSRASSSGSPGCCAISGRPSRSSITTGTPSACRSKVGRRSWPRWSAGSTPRASP